MRGAFFGGGASAAPSGRRRRRVEQPSTFFQGHAVRPSHAPITPFRNYSCVCLSLSNPENLCSAPLGRARRIDVLSPFSCSKTETLGPPKLFGCARGEAALPRPLRKMMRVALALLALVGLLALVVSDQDGDCVPREVRRRRCERGRPTGLPQHLGPPKRARAEQLHPPPIPRQCANAYYQCASTLPSPIEPAKTAPGARAANDAVCAPERAL